MKPLLVIPSPRSIPEFNEAVSKLNIDKLFMKFYPQEEAYITARNWFLERDYTHFIILPDDLIVEQKDIDMLLNECDNVISGWCVNTVKQDWGQDTNISFSLPFDPPHKATYESYNFININDLKTPHPVIWVKHSGFALTVIPRKIVEKIPFRTDEGCCVDSCLSLDLDKAKIPQYVDLRVRTKHIKTDKKDILVGKRERSIVFCKQ